MSTHTKTSKKHAPLIVGNWKMNPKTLGLAKKLFLEIRKDVVRKKLQSHVAIAAPFPFISELDRLSPSKRIKLSAQDVFYEAEGAHTGEVSLAMLKSVGVSSVIIGHSERRAMYDTDEEVYKNTEAVIKAGEMAIVCVGELVRDTQGNYFSSVEAQLVAAIKAVPKSKLGLLVIAYEPVWAIGTGNNATPEDVYEMKLFITKILVDHFGRSGAAKVRILYGGSVNADNAEILFEVGQVDGFLIGGASLKPKEFISIINTAEVYAKK